MSKCLLKTTVNASDASRFRTPLHYSSNINVIILQIFLYTTHQYFWLPTTLLLCFDTVKPLVFACHLFCRLNCEILWCEYRYLANFNWCYSCDGIVWFEFATTAIIRHVNLPTFRADKLNVFTITGKIWAALLIVIICCKSNIIFLVFLLLIHSCLNDYGTL